MARAWASASSHEMRSSSSDRNGITCAGRVEPEHAAQTATVAVEGDELARGDGPDDDLHVVVAAGAAEELDAPVVLVAPEERHRGVRRRALAGCLGQQVGGRERTLFGGVGPVLDSHLLLEQGVVPAHDVAGGVHAAARRC